MELGFGYPDSKQNNQKNEKYENNIIHSKFLSGQPHKKKAKLDTTQLAQKAVDEEADKFKEAFVAVMT